ncbi:MAG TPA: hypothetical protein VGQ17_02670 [Gemmatimonadales bacterium]|nr:hypothetical protein [Gemmatimonadales bacterium]
MTSLTSAGWIIVNRSALPLVCFTHPALQLCEELERVLANSEGARQGGRS